MAKLDLVKSLSITERMHILLPHSDELENNAVKQQLENWQKRKSLCKQHHFEEYLDLLEIDPIAFSTGIKPLDIRDKKRLWEHLCQTNWFKVNQEIFVQANETEQMNAVDFSYFARFYMRYFRKHFDLLTSSCFDCDQPSLEKVYAYVEKDLLSISLKTLVFDLHEQKKKHRLRGITSNNRFRYYLQLRFSTIHTFTEFFETYPVLWRLLAERMQFHLENFSYFMTSVKRSLNELKTLFSFSEPIHLQLDSVGNSDSHEKGKSAIIFHLNDKKLVFKYRNLVIGQKWDAFLSVIEQKTGSSFYKVKRLITSDYTIEEFIEEKSCEDESELREYYYRFGEFVAICYFLCGNDFHSENLIAYGSYPVLIDIETLLQNDSPTIEPTDSYAQAKKMKSQSVLSTGLLPTVCFTNRIEPKTKTNSNVPEGVQTSGLNGGRQLLPFKLLKIVEEKTDQIHFEYQEHYSKETGNMPKLKDQIIEPMNYAEEIMKGFDAQYTFFVTNKSFLIEKINELFEGVRVRSLLKSTQKYVDMLEYGQHVSCMNDYLEREKLFENQWAYPYKDKRVISYEIEALRVNDIPIFFSSVSTRNLFLCSDKVLENFYSRTALERVSERIASLDEKDKMYQMMLLTQAIKERTVVPTNYRLGDHAEQQIEKIIKTILNRTVVSEDGEEQVVLDFVLEQGNKTYAIATNDFYDGMIGMYIFLLYSQKFHPDFQKGKWLQIMEKSFFTESIPDITSTSVYVGHLSMITALYYRYRLKKDEKSLQQALLFIDVIKEHLPQVQSEPDWLTGVSGLIKLVSEFYRLTRNELFLELAELLVAQLDRTTVKYNGLAHGASGVLLAVTTLLPFTKNREQYLVLIQDYLLQERLHFDGQVWTDLRQNGEFTTQWCHGCTGIGLARLELLKAGISDDSIRQELLACVDQVLVSKLSEDCLCHGNTASAIFLSEVYQTEYVDEKRKQKIERKLVDIQKKLLTKQVIIEGMENYPTLGLMTGLSGIGYFWLKILHPEIPNLLILE